MHKVTSEPGTGGFPGIGRGVICILPRRCPAYRRRELSPGSDMEQENSSPRHGGARWWVSLEGSFPSCEEQQGIRVPVSGQEGGSVRSSVDGSVMEPEQRDRLVECHQQINRLSGGI